MTLAAPTTVVDVERLVDDHDGIVRAVVNAVLRTARDELDPGERGWTAAIEAKRSELERSTEPIDTALANQRGVEKPMILGEVTARRSKKGLWAVLLLALVRELRPSRILELGSCVGVSGAFLAAGARLNGDGRLVTLEGAPALAARAASGFDALGLTNVDVLPGLFRDVLPRVLDDLAPIDLAFVDGHHDEHATQQYFEQLLPHLSDPAVVVFDDIVWSDGMTRAWNALRVHPATRVSVDIDRIGVCVVGPGADTRRIDLPAVTALAASTRAREHRRSRPPAPTVDLETLSVARLNWGCGRHPRSGWLNGDAKQSPGVQLVGDLRDGLEIPAECLDYVVSMHALQEVLLSDLLPALAELRRVLRPGGVLRLGLPDLERGVAAWARGDRDYFLVPDDDATSLSGKLITQLLWYGHSVSLFTPEWTEELLGKAGFTSIEHCAFEQTSTEITEITELDDRPLETLFIEATR